MAATELQQNPDLACDTRVSVPIYADPMAGKTRIWATLGVRLAKLSADYARPPNVRPRGQNGEWQEVKSYQLGLSRYVIPVDAFAEFELPRLTSLTRQELRAVCDRCKTQEEIIRAITAKE